ncbi:hypothetical protein CBFG_04561 [Clostridiales bacterium 1_7_47FAA]|nr:hypothetical protein CBFG_04561 [Clostridiales bacterium 1_7_47FAA]
MSCAQSSCMDIMVTINNMDSDSIMNGSGGNDDGENSKLQY